MSLSRRDLLKGAAAAGAAVALVRPADAREKIEPSPDAVGMLFDSTLCVGCRACQTACKASNKLPADKVEANGGVYDAPADLNSSTKNVIKSLPTDGGGQVFVKQQCMHCVDPSCVSACMMGALHKEGEAKRHIDGEKKGSGIVLWDKWTCVGCRYCQIACAYNVPKFEWYEAFPAIVKCELCRHRADPAKDGALSVANPACAEVCPREAVIYGTREELLATARRRIAANPQKYNPKIYGEHDGGGNQSMYLTKAGVEFSELGLPDLGDVPPSRLAMTVQHTAYKGFIAPTALYVAAAVVIFRNMSAEKKAEAGKGKEEHK
jgi:Fe-S-cluster-containing dehydrogenase component